MSEINESHETDRDTAHFVAIAATPRVTKSAAVQKLLARTRGASLAEIITSTGWQNHSARAFLTGLRKSGLTIVRESRKDGETCYRIAR